MKRFSSVIKGSNSKEISIDVTCNEDCVNKKVIIFSHGFKGFKDWGCFDLVAKFFAENNFIFIKFNFSHNGTSCVDQVNFIDLEAFGNNNFSKELDDLGFVLDWVEGAFDSFIDITLIGHSRGGGISMLKSGEDKRINRVVSWASPSDFLNRMDKQKISSWKKRGVAFVYNGRTKQNMPMYIQFYEDCLKNKDRLNIQKSVRNLTIPQLIIHGDLDSSVDVKEAHDLHKWNPCSELFIVKDADHVFGASHPYNSNILPLDLEIVLNKTMEFIQ